MLAAEALDAIQRELSQLRTVEPDAHSSGARAALWRAQHEAARPGRRLEDLRRYCLEALERRSVLKAEDENDYLRGYREGLQFVLREIRRIETQAGRPTGSAQLDS